MTVKERFQEVFGMEGEAAFCPYRICPLGAHIDHQAGPILGFALDCGVHMAYVETKDGTIDLLSMNFPGQIQFKIKEIPEARQGDWCDYLRGAARYLGEKYPLRHGLKGVISGDLPSGGISSSAAVTICFLKALSAVNGIELSDTEYIYISKKAENEYVGVSSGKLDQSCETLCRKDNLLYMDSKDDSYRNIPRSPDLPDFRIGIFFSGFERSLVSSAYNNRVDECKAAAFALYSYDEGRHGLKAGLKFQDMLLRNIPEELFEEYGERLPSSWQKRCRHFYSESKRVEKGVEAWRRGDLASFATLVNESGRSSIENYECGSPWLIKLYEILSGLDGVYGARFSGAGFKGCCLALLDPSKVETIEETVEREYLLAFPELKGKYKAYVCTTADGIGRADGERF